MKIRWDVNDGYARRKRPMYAEVPDKELGECETDEEIKELIDECVQSDFENKISATWNTKIIEKIQQERKGDK